MADQIIDTLDASIVFVGENSPLQGMLFADEPKLEIWFPYSVEAIKLLEPNRLIGVKNIASIHLNQITENDNDELHLSLLRITGVTARHFQVDAIKDSRAHEPVSVEQFMNKYVKQWQRRVGEPDEPNLRLVVNAELTNFEWYLPRGAASIIEGAYPGIRPERGRPILGECCYLMNEQILERLVNRGYPHHSEGQQVLEAHGLVEMGSHALYPNDKVPVLLETKNLIKRHFGLFGFTGSGKSNLLSTLIAKTMETPEPNNLLLFDANNEYFGLTFDALLKHDSHIIFVNDEAVEGSMREFLQGRTEFANAAATEFMQTTIWSADLDRKLKTSEQARNSMLTIIKMLMTIGAFKVFTPDPEQKSFDEFLNSIEDWATSNLKFAGKGSQAKNKVWSQVLRTWLVSIVDDATLNLAPPLLVKIQIDLILAIKSLNEPSDDDATESLLTTLISKALPDDMSGEMKTFAEPLEKLADQIKTIQRSIAPPDSGYVYTIGINGMIRALHDDKRSIMVLLGEENPLRIFAHAIGMFMYRLRKKTQMTKTPTSFIFDEADLFIPSQSPSKEDAESIALSKEVATMLARRGRKYNLGLGIATQRVTYLDTSIMGQLGTYFVGRLPRASDRLKVVEAFGVDDSLLESGVKGIGNWVVLSHVAVGDKGAPIPVHFSNADQRTLTFLDEFDPQKFPTILQRLLQADYHSALEKERATLVKPLTHTDYLPK